MGPDGFISLPSPPSSPLSSLFFFPKTPKFQPNFKFFKTKAAMVSDKSFRFKSLTEICTVDVQRAKGRELNVPFIVPFTIATSRLRIELSNECSGWGEVPILPFVTVEDQQVAMVKAAEVCEFLKRSPRMTLSSVLGEIGGTLHGHEFASVRTGVEMALIDAVDSSVSIPLWRLFDGVSNTITTAITIPIVSPAEAAQLASKYIEQGFKTLKLKVGKNLNADVQVLQAVRMAHLDCLLTLDANEGYAVTEAIQLLQLLHEMKATPVLFEQPVHMGYLLLLMKVAEI